MYRNRDCRKSPCRRYGRKDYRRCVRTTDRDGFHLSGTRQAGSEQSGTPVWVPGDEITFIGHDLVTAVSLYTVYFGDDTENKAEIIGEPAEGKFTVKVPETAASGDSLPGCRRAERRPLFLSLYGSPACRARCAGRRASRFLRALREACLP